MNMRTIIHCILGLLIVTIATVTASQEAKQLFHIILPQPLFRNALLQFGDEWDIWRVQPIPDTKELVHVDIYTTEMSIRQFREDIGSLQELKIERNAVSTARLLQESETTFVLCSEKTRLHLDELASTKYVDNAFFDCWRTADEIYAFLNKLVKENSGIFAKIDSIATSRAIPAYKISTGPGRKVIYVQGLLHAREWHAGSTTFYAIAALLDGFRCKDPEITQLLTLYDWYFVPIVNIDGFRFTFKGDRLWRKNRHKINVDGKIRFGVDLNRNFGPAEYFALSKGGPRSDTYPGSSPLSEPETFGLFQWLQTLPLAGALDIHAFAGYVLRPLGNQKAGVLAPYDTKLKTLGDNVKKAIEVSNNATYTSQSASELYLSYGSFMDAVFLQMNHTATLTFEMEGEGFVLPETVIRPGGKHVFQGILQFAKELPAYYS